MLQTSCTRQQRTQKILCYTIYPLIQKDYLHLLATGVWATQCWHSAMPISLSIASKKHGYIASSSRRQLVEKRGVSKGATTWYSKFAMQPYKKLHWFNFRSVFNSVQPPLWALFHLKVAYFGLLETNSKPTETKPEYAHV